MAPRRPKRLALFAILAGLAVAWAVLAPRVPHDQVVHVVLGDAAPRVSEVRIHYVDSDSVDAREVTFGYTPNESPAPRIVTHEARLANGTYSIVIELATAKARNTVSRSVKLEGSPVSIDVSDQVP